MTITSISMITTNLWLPHFTRSNLLKFVGIPFYTDICTMFEKSEQPKPAEPEPNLNRDMEEQLHAAVKKYDGTFICVVDGLLKKNEHRIRLRRIRWEKMKKQK